MLESTRLSRRTAGELYAARWGVELDYRALKQTLGRRRLQSRTPATGALELAANLLGLGLLQAQAAWLLRGRVVRASVALLLRALREALAVLALRGRSSRFCTRVQAALRDDYTRRRSKRARDWPHKKKEAPPRAPKLRRLTIREKAEIERWNPPQKLRAG